MSESICLLERRPSAKISALCARSRGKAPQFYAQVKQNAVLRYFSPFGRIRGKATKNGKLCFPSTSTYFAGSARTRKRQRPLTLIPFSAEKIKIFGV